MLQVLIVDDNPDTAESLAQLVRLWGHAARAASDGPSGLAAARELPPHVALIDIAMPGMTGHDLASRLRRLPGMDTALLIGITGHAEGTGRQVPPGDFDLFLIKPLDPQELERLLRSYAADTGAA
jgi:CheY-like chemotaxis protein